MAAAYWGDTCVFSEVLPEVRSILFITEKRHGGSRTGACLPGWRGGRT